MPRRNAGVGLMKINTNLAGYAPSWEGALLAVQLLAFKQYHAAFRTFGGYGKLAYGDSIQLPLFAQTSEDANQVENTHDFMWSFIWVMLKEFGFPSLQTDDPVLRWKIQRFSGAWRGARWNF